MWGLGMNGLPKEMSDYLNRMLLEEQEDREAFAAELEIGRASCRERV